MFLRKVVSIFRAPWLRAASVLFSTIVGAGMLSIPYTVSRVGIVVGTLYIVGMGLLMCVLHIVVAEIVIRTRTHLQLAGIVRKYVGASAMWVMTFVFLILHLGAMVAYLIGEGESLSALLGGPAVFWAVLFFIFGTTIIIRGVKSVTRFDFWMNIGTLVVVGILVSKSFPAAHLWLYAPAVSSSLLVPFGVLLFAFHGTSAIPELEMIVGTDAHALRKAVLVGSLVPIILYAVFAIVVVAVTGENTTQIATIGLGNAISPAVIVIGNVFAIIAMSSSYVNIGQALRRTFQWDYGWRETTAIAVAVGVPFAIYMFGAREFINVIAFVGASCGTVEIILLVWAYGRMNSAHKREYEKNSNSRRRVRRS